MAFTQGSLVTWSDMNNIFIRVKSEQSKWGQTQSSLSANAAQGKRPMASDVNTLRSALITLSGNSFLSSFLSNAQASSSTAKSPGDKLMASGNTGRTSTNVIENLRANLNAIRGICGAYVNSCFGSQVTTYSKHSSFNSSHTNTDSNGSGFYFYGAWTFYNYGNGNFRHTVSYNNHSATAFTNFCSAFWTCSPFCKAGFCTSYDQRAL